MAKKHKQHKENVHRGPRYESKVSYLLEEKIDVPFQLVGYGDWLEAAIPASARKGAIVIRPQREEQDLVPVLTKLWAKKIMGLDLETGGELENDGLDPLSQTSRVLLAQVGTPEMIYIFEPALIPFLREPFESKQILHLNQNITFDFKWLLKKYHIHLVRMYCTMLAEQVLRAGRDGFGVSLLDLSRYHPPCRLISKEVRGQFIHHSGVFTEEQLYYAARDIFLLFDIFHSQNKEIEKYGLADVVRDEFECIPATAEMELTGVNLNLECLDLSISYWKAELERLEKGILTELNDELKKKGLYKADYGQSLFDLFAAEEDEDPKDYFEDFNLDSTEQLLEILNRIGLKLANVQRSTLKLIAHKIGGMLVDRSVAKKLVSTYGDRLKEMCHPSDGRLHPRFKQLGAGEDGYKSGGRDLKATIATGRFSSDFQNLPRPADIYTPANEEELTFVYANFSDRILQLELEAM